MQAVFKCAGLAVATMLYATGCSKPASQATDAVATEQPAIPAGETVTPESYIRVEADRNFQNIYGLSGNKINTLFHFRQPTMLDKQAEPV